MGKEAIGRGELDTPDGGRYVGIVAVAAAIYFAVAKLSLLLAFKQANTSAVWPASGLAIGGLVVFGIRYWPAVTAGVFALTMSIDPVNLGGALAISLGNTLEAVVGATLINRFAGGSDCLRGALTVFRFAFYAAILAPLLSAGIGVSGLALSGVITWDDVGEISLTWYTGNTAGVLVFAPLVMLLSNPQRPWSRKRKIEGVALLVILILVGQAICGIFLNVTIEQFPGAYMVIPVLLWVAFRLGRRGTVAALIVLMAIAVAGTVRGYVVFPGATPNLSLLYLQIFLSVVSLMSLVVAGLVSELMLANESLEQKVENRTRRLKAMMREKDDLMAIAAHDLRAPLAGMRNLLQLVQSRPETLSSEAAARVIEEMESTTDGMLDLVSSLLVAKRAEELEMNLTHVPCDAVELIHRIAGMYRETAAKKGIEVRIDAPEKLPVSTHPESFSQIASNLISNAIKYSPTEEAVEVQLGSAAEPKSILLEVRDRGMGIPPEEADLIFHKFSRGDSQPTAGEVSHGIGLYIVEKLTVALGGTVEYTERPGGGSCFTVRLPAVG